MNHEYKGITQGEIKKAIEKTTPSAIRAKNVEHLTDEMSDSVEHFLRNNGNTRVLMVILVASVTAIAIKKGYTDFYIVRLVNQVIRKVRS